MHDAHSPAGTSAGQLSLSQCPFFCPRSATRCNSDTTHRDVAPLPSDDWSGRWCQSPWDAGQPSLKPPEPCKYRGSKRRLLYPTPVTGMGGVLGRAPHTHTWPLPGAPLAADNPQSPAPSFSAPALPAGVCLVPGKVSGSQTLQGLGFRKCNDFMHFQSNLKTPKVMLYLGRASPSALTHEVNSASQNFTASF